MNAPASPLAQFSSFLARKGRRVWRLTVTGKEQITPHMVRVRFKGPDLDELVWKRGQDLVIKLPDAGGQIARRHYTIRQHDAKAGTLAIDFVQHGDSPAGRWLTGVKSGDAIDGAGPRGHTYLHDADWHLFIGDETCIPGIFAMLEALPRGARAFVFIEIANEAEKQTVETPSDATIRWIVRKGDALEAAVAAFALPSGRGHAYVIGETSKIRTIRHGLLSRGLGKDQISAEGYWRPGRVGGHDHV
jgi:NADPH-dependent ferric siderophore reductase